MENRNGSAGSVFLAFDSCPSCGSRDNLSRWSDGHAWCFGCKYFEAGTTASRIPQISEIVNPGKLRLLPEDTSTSIGAKGWQWLRKYGIMDSEATNFRWSDENEWLIYLIDATAWQARCFNPNAKRRYLTFGAVADCLHIVGDHENREEIVVVEDIVSALKVGRKTNCIPIFGSNVGLKLLTRLANRFKRLGVWLDKDKAVESTRTAARASQLGFDSVRSIISELDPKEYSDEVIAEYLFSKGGNYSP